MSVPTTSKDPCHICTGVDKEHIRALQSSGSSTKNQLVSDCNWRRQCGCLKTSDKLKELLKCFPAAPPPPPPNSPTVTAPNAMFETTCISAYCTNLHQPVVPVSEPQDVIEKSSKPLLESPKKTITYKSWRVVADLVQLVQLSVTATALALYYIIYCYMQLVYYTLRSAVFFHNADGPMRITIGVVTVTSLVVGFNLLLRIERLVGLTY